MTTFQSQINILAAGQHQLHKRIDEITDLHLVAKYDSLDTFIFDNVDGDSIKIEGLGYQSFDCILTVDGADLHFMDYKGLCENFNSITVTLPSPVSKITTTKHAEDSVSVSGTTLTLYSNTFDSTSKNYTYPKIINLATQLVSNTTASTTEGIKSVEETGNA